MTNPHKIPPSDAPLVRELAKTMTDGEIAARYNCSNTVVVTFRKRHDIPTYHKRGRQRPKPEPIILPTPTKHLTSDGYLVTLCPPMYAAGIIMQASVRPSGRRQIGC